MAWLSHDGVPSQRAATLLHPRTERRHLDLGTLTWSPTSICLACDVSRVHGRSSSAAGDHPDHSIFLAVILVRPEFLPLVPSEWFCPFAYCAS
jgi:hypothetical protein